MRDTCGRRGCTGAVKGAPGCCRGIGEVRNDEGAGDVKGCGEGAVLACRETVKLDHADAETTVLPRRGEQRSVRQCRCSVREVTPIPGDKLA